MPRLDDNGRPPLVAAMQWVNQILTISLEMVLPAGVGYLLDNRWNTTPWLVAVGSVLGFVVAMRHLLKIAAAANRKN